MLCCPMGAWDRRLLGESPTIQADQCPAGAARRHAGGGGGGLPLCPCSCVRSVHRSTRIMDQTPAYWEAVLSAARQQQWPEVGPCRVCCSLMDTLGNTVHPSHPSDRAAVAGRADQAAAASNTALPGQPGALHQGGHRGGERWEGRGGWGPRERRAALPALPARARSHYACLRGLRWPAGFLKVACACIALHMETCASCVPSYVHKLTLLHPACDAPAGRRPAADGEQARQQRGGRCQRQVRCVVLHAVVLGAVACVMAFQCVLSAGPPATCDVKPSLLSFPALPCSSTRVPPVGRAADRHGGGCGHE